MKSKNLYTLKYFKERDYLDLRIAETIKIFMQEKGLKRVLDVGCGTGKLVEYLNSNDLDAWGCDKAEEAVRLASKRNERKIIKASASKLSFPSRSFDLVTSISLIEHLTKKQVSDFIMESKRVLNPGGYIFLVTPNYSTPLRFIQGDNWCGYSDPTHINFYTPGSLSTTLKKYNFKDIKLWFKTIYDVPLSWDLPDFILNLPKPFRMGIVFLLWSTPLAIIRSSIWMLAQRK